MSLLTPLHDKVLAHKSAIIGSGFSVISIACIVGIRVGLHMMINILIIKKTMFRSMLEIFKYTKSNISIDFFGCMQKLAKKTHTLSDIPR